MYFAVCKLTFADDNPELHDERALKAVSQKIAGRFKISVLPYQSFDRDGTASIALTCLGRSEKKLSRLLDDIVDYCEDAGIGRIHSEEVLMDHVDNLDDT